MKKIYLFIVLSALLLSSCKNVDSNTSSNISSNSTLSNSISKNNSQETKGDSMSSAESRIIQETKDTENLILSRASEKDYKELIHYKVPAIDIERKYLTYMFHTITSNVRALTQLNEDYKIECIRRTSNTSAYTIHETDEGGLFYGFFNKLSNNDNWFMLCSIYSCKKLSYKDFSSVNKGTTIFKVKDIDPSVSVRISTSKDFEATQTFHLLTDGIVVLTYKRNNKGELNVTSKDYYKDFIVKINFGGYEDTYNYKILKKDYIH